MRAEEPGRAGDDAGRLRGLGVFKLCHARSNIVFSVQSLGGFSLDSRKNPVLLLEKLKTGY
jgi:hypothetical protein